MSQNNPIRLFVTHAWDTSDEYLRIFEYLESARNFFYKNLSAPDKAPKSGGVEADREELRRQIAQAECVIALPGLYRQQSDLLQFELTFAKASDKPVILMKPFGANQVLPKAITDFSDQIVEWDGRALVDAIKAQARHEESNRWDTIEFKLE
jgi:antiphage defense system Thoeris ThsB-like protein